MDENIIIPQDIPLEEQQINLDEIGVVPIIIDDSPVTEIEEDTISSNNDIISSDIADKVVNIIQESASQYEEPKQIDYSQQLYDLSFKLDTISNQINNISLSNNDLYKAVLDEPEYIYQKFENIIQFQYLTMSLYVGLIVAILFFKGLKK